MECRMPHTCFCDDGIAAVHKLMHVGHKSKCMDLDVGPPLTFLQLSLQLLIAPTHNHKLAHSALFANLTHCCFKLTHALAAAYHEHGRKVLIQAKSAAQEGT
jgi:hypothetical protein